MPEGVDTKKILVIALIPFIKMCHILGQSSFGYPRLLFTGDFIAHLIAIRKTKIEKACLSSHFV